MTGQDLDRYAEGVRVCAWYDRNGEGIPKYYFKNRKGMWQCERGSISGPRHLTALKAYPGHATAQQLVEAADRVELACIVFESVGGGRVPERKTPGAAAFDCYARLDERVYTSHGVLKVPLGFKMEVPQGYFGQLVGRSSQYQHGMEVLHGVIDGDYRGEVHAVVKPVLTNTDVVIQPGDRVAQLLISRTAAGSLSVVESPVGTETERGDRGFGHTGRR